VEGLSHKDGAGNGQVGLAGDQRGTSEVGAGSNTLKDRREAEETVNILVGEGVVASGVRGDTSGSQGTREKLDVLLLVVSDVLEVLVVLGALSCAIVSVKSSEACGCKILSHTSVDEVLLGELVESTLVEDVLEVLEGESELEDSGVDVVALNERSSAGNSGQERHGTENGVLHDCLRRCC
jgi:hypothetical protein